MKQKLQKPLSKFSPKVLIVIVLPLVAFGIYTLLSSKAATPAVPNTANFWVDLSANPNSCTRQNTPGNYSDTGACGSLSDAFLAASCGDRIYVKGTTGTYHQQKLTSGHAGTCTEILVAATPGENVNIDDLVLDGASNIRVKGAGSKKTTGYGAMNVGNSNPDVGSPDIRGGTNVVFDGINYVSSGQVVGGTNITIENSDIGPFTPVTCPGAGMPIANNSSTPVTGFTFRDNYVHDYRFTNCTPPNDHLDCIHMYEFLRGLTIIEGNKIENCQNYGILMEGTSNAKIRNNWFGSVVTNCGFAFHGGAVADNFSDITIEFNSAKSCITPQTTNNLTNVIMRGNVASNVGGVCRPGITYSYNKQIDGGSLAAVCGTGDSVSVNPGYINTNTGSLDLHVQSGSVLKDAGGSVCPTLDYDAETRPSGASCDVGADEVGGESGTIGTPGDVNGDNSVNISDISALLTAYGQTGSNLPADLDKNSAVNIQDLSIILTNYGKTGTGTVTCTGAQHTPGGPDGMGGCWPGVDNTGPSALESSMPAYTGSCTLNATTTIDSKVINCSPLVIGSSASGSVVKNSYVHGGVIQASGSASFTIQDSVIDNAVNYPSCASNGGSQTGCPAGKYACGDPNNATIDCGVGYKNFTILRTEIFNTNRAAYCESTCTIQDSYFHGTNLWPDETNLAHASSVRNEQFLTLRHNALGCDYAGPFPNGELGCSADMSGYPDFAPIKNATIDKNLFLTNNIGTGFCVYGGGTSGKPFSSDPANATNIKFTDNIFQRGANGKCGSYGPVTDFISGRTGNVWTNNKYDNGTIVNSN